ncbi:RimJ/RimL family protein N-acetyltransferase [Azospirillum lipoferum]|uniref:GNAT family N-acetyltransferase n=1 Tax=Azospirillum lipoferum TaxID=193 RepID=A0A5A9GY88_AZOLI|nr:MULTISPECIES: GNAT family protein [Azospirillum]KAA0598459.1 GNAT family N-acetyltransferase [Azospirillum lipoferum]MCP1609545.1 RimJ/RimL family protein N-acetyltransferase [Azospirillum lipoferum]MDW5535146.1 GNAT family protein [Azospirillum sp. NL1]
MSSALSHAVLSHRPLADTDIPTICGFPRDAEELYFLFPRAVWPLTPDQVRATLGIRRDPTVATLIGDGRERVVGYANYATFEDGRTASIGNVSVDPGLRRRGIAEYLVRTMIDRAFDHHHLSELTLYCFSTNTPALLLYAKLGMVPIALETRVTPWGEPIALFKLRMDRAGWCSAAPIAA